MSLHGIFDLHRGDLDSRDGGVVLLQQEGWDTHPAHDGSVAEDSIPFSIHHWCGNRRHYFANNLYVKDRHCRALGRVMSAAPGDAADGTKGLLGAVLSRSYATSDAVIAWFGLDLIADALSR